MSAQGVIVSAKECSKVIFAPVPSGDARLMKALVALLWSDAEIASDFVRGKKGWEHRAASVLSVDSFDVKKLLKGTGRQRINKLVDENPVGAPPSRHGQVIKASPFGMSSYDCATGTGSGCGTSSCGTSQCPTYACPYWPTSNSCAYLPALK